MKRFPLNLTLRSFSFAYVTGIALALAQPAYAGASEGDSLQDVWSILIELMIVIA